MASLEKRISQKNGDIFKLIKESITENLNTKPTWLIEKIANAGEDSFGMSKNKIITYAQEKIMDYFQNNSSSSSKETTLNAYIYGTTKTILYVINNLNSNNLVYETECILYENPHPDEKYDFTKEIIFNHKFFNSLNIISEDFIEF